MDPASEEIARSIAHLLAGGWRRAPTAPSTSANDVTRALPFLQVSGATPLAWWRLRNTPVALAHVGRELHRSYLAHAAAGLVQEREIALLFGALRAAGVEPILSKGWAIARHYPEPGLRPSADIDLFVAPAELERAERALATPELDPIRVDLHAGIPDLPDLPFHELMRRSALVPLGPTSVRVLAADDHLKHVILHLLRHAAWRPIWLCDVGALVEAPGLDWDRLLATSPTTRNWLRAVLALSHSLMGARLTGTPVEDAPAELPGWLEPAVLAHWLGLGDHLYDGNPLVAFLFRPAAFRRALAKRWPSPLQASVSLRAPFDARPRLPLQIAEYVGRAVFSLVRLPLTLCELRLAKRPEAKQY